RLAADRRPQGRRSRPRSTGLPAMSGKPVLDDYFDALLGEAPAAAPPQAPAAASAAPASPPLPATPAADLADDLDAVFEQAHAEAKAAGVFEQHRAADAPAADLADDLDAA